ncbi:MAG: leucyl/phenylalanyl-tRNA--protein transferase [Kofleriaceae bacterium]
MVFPAVLAPDAEGLVFVGGNFTRATVTEAYTRGLFPWRGGDAIPWYCPDPRAVIRPGTLRVTHSLAKRARTASYTVAFDHDFRGAMTRCATTPRRHESSTWITPDVIDGYSRLHDAGLAHSVEVYAGDEPIGGLYGLAFGRIFHGESMYHRARDASKLALWALDQALLAHGFTLLDCQVPTPHLMSLGAEAWRRDRYLAQLAENSAAPTLHESWQSWRVTCLPPR